MKDSLPSANALPSDHLVAPESQPEYLAVPGADLSDRINAGCALSDDLVAAGLGRQLALVAGGESRGFTYSQLAELSDKAAHSLVRWGVQPGDRVALRSPNVPEAIVLACAIWKAGAIVVPTSPQARSAELAYYLDDTQPRVMIWWEADALGDEVLEALSGSSVENVFRFGPLDHSADADWSDAWSGLLAPSAGNELPEVGGDDLAIIWHTGGTTGKPKGCYHTHVRFVLAGKSLGQAARIRHGERWACAAPIGHALGFIHNTNFSVLNGATAVLIRDFKDPRVLLDCISTEKIGTFTAIAASWAGMLDCVDQASPDLSSIERAYAMWQSATSSEVADGWASRGISLLNNFGSTAFATWVLLPQGDNLGPSASLGRAAPGYEVVALSLEGDGSEEAPVGVPGRMAVRGPSGLTYWGLPEIQARDVVDGWTLVDDLIQLESDGNFSYLGRTDFLISSAGFKITPGEIEAVLAGHEAVKEVAVVGAPDPVRREVVAAFLAVNPGHQGSEDLKLELQELVRSSLSPYKYPRRVEFVVALPRDQVGKVQTNEVSQWAKNGIPESMKLGLDDE